MTDTSIFDADGLHKDRPDTIATFSGKRVPPLNMELDDIDIVDIAHALAHICRYGGHSVGHLSVARHSIWASQIVEPMGNPVITLTALLHDAAEAYLGDIVRPLKRTDGFKAYLVAEERLEAQLAIKYGTVFPLPEVVLEADRYVLNEVELAGARQHWDAPPEQDEYDFLDRFYELRNKIDPWIIGISGYAGVGKDTLGRVLVDHDGRERFAFADVMREGLYALNPLIGTSEEGDEYRLQTIIDEVGWDTAKRLYPEIRTLQERFGTEAGRDIHGQDVWVDLAMSKLDRDKRYVITDVRFPNELKAVHEAGGQVWRINRDGVDAGGTHPSRTALDLADFDRVFDVPPLDSGAEAQLWYLSQLPHLTR